MDEQSSLRVRVYPIPQIDGSRTGKSGMTDQEVHLFGKFFGTQELTGRIDSRQRIECLHPDEPVTRARFRDTRRHLTADARKRLAQLLVEDRYPVVSRPLRV